MAGEHGAGDDPVYAAAVGDLGGAAGLVSGLVAEGGMGGLTSGLDLSEVGDVADSDGEFGHVEQALGIGGGGGDSQAGSGRWGLFKVT